MANDKRQIELWKALNDVIITTVDGENIEVYQNQIIEVVEKFYFYERSSPAGKNVTIKKEYFRTFEGEYQWYENYYLKNFIRI